MEAIYEIMETLLPFEFVNYDFMKNAILAVILLCPIFAILRHNDSKQQNGIFLRCPRTFRPDRNSNRNDVWSSQHKYINDNICNSVFSNTKLCKTQNKLWSRHNNKCILINSYSPRACNSIKPRQL